MRLIDKTPKISRRNLMRTGAMTAAAVAVAPTTAFSAAPEAISAESFATLVKMARDLYPHDKLADAFYAKVISGHDADAKKDPATKTMLEEGVETARRPQRAHGLRQIRRCRKRGRPCGGAEGAGKAKARFLRRRARLAGHRPLQQPGALADLRLRGLIAPSKGGYIDRGFDDIDWLSKA